LLDSAVRLRCQDVPQSFFFSQEKQLSLDYRTSAYYIQMRRLSRGLFVVVTRSSSRCTAEFLFFEGEERIMNRQRFGWAAGLILLIAGSAQAAVYDDIFWVGGDGEWTGDVGATPSYATGNWSTDPNATSGLPAKFVLGRNDGLRVGEVVGSGPYDLDRLPCDSAAACTTTPAVTISGGTQLGTDVYINKPVTVFYNPNRQLLPGDDGLDRFADFRFQPNASFPGTPTLNLSNGAVFEHQSSINGDPDGMWTRWNGAGLTIDNATFRRTGDAANGFPGGAWMFASYHGYANSVQTVDITNGGQFINEGQAWFGNEPGIDVIVTINNGHMDFSGGDEYELNNDGLPLRADLTFVYNHKPDGDMDTTDDETYIINFTGPGTIKVDGDVANPLDGDTTTGGGGIRIARQTGATMPVGTPPEEEAVYVGADTQVSYQDLWGMGILQANGLSGLDSANFNDFFTVTNNPGDTDYTLTSLVVPENGDHNGDGVVDAADYVAWRKDPANNGGDPGGYNAWQENFGESVPGSGGAVPEPATMFLMLMGLASLSFLRQRSR
jgi:hypothetical protein